MSRSRRLLDACAGALDRALDMRFVREVHAGSIDDHAYADYLAIEASFVETATRLHGLAIWDAPGETAMIRNARAAHALTTEQADYFRTARAAWPVPARLGPAAAREAGGLSAYALAAARDGGYAAVVTVLFAAESLYLAWCTRAHEEGRPPPGPIADWVALHATPAFREGVGALAGEVDGLPPSVPDARLTAWFEGMLDAEIAFHGAVYDQDPLEAGQEVRVPGSGGSA